MSLTIMEQKNTKDEIPFGYIKAILKQYVSYFAISMSCPTRTVLFARSIKDLLKN